MAKTWTDLGNGQHKLVITVDGNPAAQPSVFRGTKDEILEKLADSQANANRHIADLRRPDNGGAPLNPVPPAGPRALSAAERLATVADLQNPATVDQAATRLVESVLGPVSEFQRDRQSDRMERITRQAVQAAETFADNTPEWYASDHNKQLVADYVRTQGLNPTEVQSYATAFERLTAANLLQQRPPDSETDNDEPELEGRNAPSANAKPRTPTRYSTSVRPSDISGRPPVPSGKPHLKYTREQLDNMSSARMRELMQTDRAELERCINYYAKTPARQAS